MTDATKQDALRTKRVDSSDRRVVKTRQKLVDAYRRLSDADPGAAISVTSLVQEAGITRSSFYAHFSDASELASIALSEFQDAVISFARTAVLAGGSKRQINERVMREIARFILERRETYGPLITAGGSFAEATAEAFTQQNLTTLRTRTTLHADPDVTARYMAGGLTRVLAWWLSSGTVLSPDDLARALIDVLPADFVD